MSGQTKTKICSSCGSEELVTNFYATNSKIRGHVVSAKCKPCFNARNIELKKQRGGYSKSWTQKLEEDAAGVKTCPYCSKIKTLDNFLRRESGKIESYCILCTAIYNKKYQAVNKERRRSVRRLRMYGVTDDHYQQMLNDQNHSCASCYDKFPFDKSMNLETMDVKHVHLDHNHVSGQVRGILCHHCNIALGHLKEDSNRIKNLLDYLKGYE